VFDSSLPRSARPEVRAHPVELLSTRIVRWLAKPGAISAVQVDLRDPGRSCWYCGGGEGPFETEHPVTSTCRCHVGPYQVVSTASERFGKARA
jgi:hypothetical protein